MSNIIFSKPVQKPLHNNYKKPSRNPQQHNLNGYKTNTQTMKMSNLNSTRTFTNEAQNF